MERLHLLAQQTSSAGLKHVDSAIDFLGLPSLITPEENAIRLKVRDLMEKEIVPHIHEYIEEAKFPEFVIPKIREANFVQHFFKEPYGKPFSTSGIGMVVAEIARGDASVSTFLLVQTVLFGYTIELLGTE